MVISDDKDDWAGSHGAYYLLWLFFTVWDGIVGISQERGKGLQPEYW